MRCCWFFMLLLCGAARAAVDAPAPAADPAREEFRAALDHVSENKPVTDSAALRAYLLYPYLEAARLRMELSRVKATERAAPLEQRIREFLKTHGDEPVTRELLHDWLAYFGERKAWSDFQAAAPADLADRSLRCYALSARLALQQLAGLREAVLELWLKDTETVPACAPIFQWLDNPERVGDGDLEARARLAAMNRVPPPKALSALLPERRALALLWDRLMAVPDRELERYLAHPPKDLPAPPDPGVGDALLEAFDRAARRDSRAARPLLARLRQSAALNEEQRGRLQRSWALGLAYDFDADAFKAFGELPEAAVDALSQEWRVRVALRVGEWQQALRWLEAMPKVQQDEPRWRYWRARMLEREHPAEAQALYADVAKEREYYAFLAAERLGRKPDLRPKPAPDDAKVQATLAALPAMRRAHELQLCELTALAAQELHHALRDRGAAEKIQAAHLIAGWGWHEPAVRLLSELQQWDELVLRFPLPYDRQVDAAAKDAQLSPEWLYAVLRTESLYDPRAVSPAGALGLLQLRLYTARQVAQRSGLPKPVHDDLFKPEVNIPLAARYLRELHDRCGQRLILTLAAYNAGPLHLPEWLPAKPIDADIWIETIPYNETRIYVQRVLSSVVILSWRRRGEPAQLLPLLQPVAANLQDGPP